MSKIFFDANILLDILLPNRANHKLAIHAYENICDQYDVLATSENILTTIEYIATKHDTPCHKTAAFFLGLQESFELYGFGEILEKSLVIYQHSCIEKHNLDFEDLLQSQCAIVSECDLIVTNDKKFVEGKVKHISLEEALKTI